MSITLKNIDNDIDNELFNAIGNYKKVFESNIMITKKLFFN